MRRGRQQVSAVNVAACPKAPAAFLARAQEGRLVFPLNASRRGQPLRNLWLSLCEPYWRKLQRLLRRAATETHPGSAPASPASLSRQAEQRRRHNVGLALP